ncbi:MAG: hypothetical protein AAGA99_13780 [Actinomycetota bacterium]
MAPRTVLVRLALLLAPLGGLTGSIAVSADEAPPRLTTVDLAPQIEGSVGWALGLFDEAGLELPPLVIAQHRGTEACSGHPAVHRFDGRVSSIHLCDPEPGGYIEYLLLHEVAHAWAARSLTPEAESAFQALRGYPVWRDHTNFAWHQNGTEQAAEIMVWGLIDRPFVPARIDDNGCTALVDGYRTLTGRTPLHGFTDLCRSEETSVDTRRTRHRPPSPVWGYSGRRPAVSAIGG